MNKHVQHIHVFNHHGVRSVRPCTTPDVAECKEFYKNLSDGITVTFEKVKETA